MRHRFAVYISHQLSDTIQPMLKQVPTAASQNLVKQSRLDQLNNTFNTDSEFYLIDRQDKMAPFAYQNGYDSETPRVASR